MININVNTHISLRVATTAMKKIIPYSVKLDFINS